MLQYLIRLSGSKKYLLKILGFSSYTQLQRLEEHPENMTVNQLMKISNMLKVKISISKSIIVIANPTTNEIYKVFDE